ncbi:carboxypeptidase B [Plutella xylostella]|uniref:carboxypeptidase B n=1 Tax=Plutella xylostella TaxID=51655 RepID=UPI002032FF94|nr:carboxypeptidase B [Plutella xylostella]
MMRWTILFGILGLSWHVKCEEGLKYDNHSLVRLIPKTEQQLSAVHQLPDAGEMEVLKRSRMVNDSFDVLVPETKKGYMEDFAKEHGMDFHVKEDNYGRSFAPVQRSARRRSNQRLNIFGYNSFDTINAFLEQTAAAHPGLAQVQPLKRSSQGRQLKLMKISTNPGANNPIIFVDAGIHAREWAAPAMAVYLIHRLTSDPAAREDELNGVDWYILPNVNPDGYEFTRYSRGNRLWRKTRSRSSARSDCFGVDGNRNYGFKWGVSGVSRDPCNQETYAGPEPFSEPETRMVRDVMMENAKRLKLYVSLHSYGNYLVYPWGYTGASLPDDWRKLDTLAHKVSKAIVGAGGSPLKVLSAGHWYPAAGGSDDYAYGVVGVPYSYTMELTDGYEFQLPAKMLPKLLPQFYEGFKEFARNIRSEFGTVRSRDAE